MAVLKLNHDWHQVVQRKRGDQRLLYGRLRSGEMASSVTGTSHLSGSQQRQAVVTGGRLGFGLAGLAYGSTKAKPS